MIHKGETQIGTVQATFAVLRSEDEEGIYYRLDDGSLDAVNILDADDRFGVALSSHASQQDDPPFVGTAEQWDAVLAEFPEQEQR